MNVRVGCDLVEVKRFEGIDEDALKKIFHPTELENRKPETLAGIFAAKEAVKKVFNELDWHDIEIQKEESGKPILLLHPEKKIMSQDVSISHDKDYAMATVVFIIGN